MTKLWNKAHKENRKRDRAKKCYVAPKSTTSREKLARKKLASIKRDAIKAYNLIKDELEARDLNEIMRFNVVVSCKFPSEFKFRGFKAREREIKAIMQLNELNSSEGKVFSFGSKPMRTKKLEKILLKEVA